MNFVVMRPAETQEEGGSSRDGRARRPEPQYFRRQSTYMKVKLIISSQTNAQITVKYSIFHPHLFGLLPAVGCWNLSFLLHQ